LESNVPVIESSRNTVGKNRGFNRVVKSWVSAVGKHENETCLTK